MQEGHRTCNEAAKSGLLKGATSLRSGGQLEGDLLVLQFLPPPSPSLLQMDLDIGVLYHQRKCFMKKA